MKSMRWGFFLKKWVDPSEMFTKSWWSKVSPTSLFPQTASRSEKSCKKIHHRRGCFNWFSVVVTAPFPMGWFVCFPPFSERGFGILASCLRKEKVHLLQQLLPWMKIGGKTHILCPIQPPGLKTQDEMKQIEQNRNLHIYGDKHNL